MADVFELGRRPFVKEDAIESTGEALSVCPGVNLSHDVIDSACAPDMFKTWGPVLAVWEGHAVNEDIRFSGSSGGAATALGLFCIESKKMDGVVHTAINHDIPYLNKTVMSSSREKIVQTTGSRYSPSSPAEGLDSIEKSSHGMAFIGKPCDVAAVANARKIRPSLDNKLGPVIGFFCAGTPSVSGLFDLLKEVGIPSPTSLSSLRYRGKGWPGLWTADFTDSNGTQKQASLSYAKSWGYLQKYRQWRCHICPDHTAEFADIAVGDPWYREIQKDEPGSSLIIARTKYGLDIINAAEKAGYIKLIKEDLSLLPRSQPNIQATRGAVWGRLLTMKLLGCETPNYLNMPVFHAWLKKLTIRQKLQSIFGTMKRIVKKGLRKKANIHEWKEK